MRKVVAILFLFICCTLSNAQSAITILNNPKYYRTDTLCITFKAPPSWKVVDLKFDNKQQALPNIETVNKNLGLYKLVLRGLPIREHGVPINVEIMFANIDQTDWKQLRVYYYMPKIQALTVGVSDYRHQPLTWPSAGANQVYKAISQSQLLKKDYFVNPAIVVTENERLRYVTREAVIEAFSQVSDPDHSSDIYLIYLSGHGGEIEGQYVFKTADEKSITQEEILQLVSRLAERNSKIFLFVDTCFSGKLKDYIEDNISNSSSISIITAGTRKEEVGDFKGFYTALSDALIGTRTFRTDYSELSTSSISGYIYKETHGLGQYHIESSSNNIIITEFSQYETPSIVYCLPFTWRDKGKYNKYYWIDWATNSCFAVGLIGGAYSTYRYLSYKNDIASLDNNGISSLNARNSANVFYNTQFALYGLSLVALAGKAISVACWSGEKKKKQADFRSHLDFYPTYSPMLGTSLAFVYTF